MAFWCCFRLKILIKDWHVFFYGFMFAQGFPWKVAMTVVMDDHCSERSFAFSQRDFLKKSRWQEPSTIVARMHVLHSRTKMFLKSREIGSFENTLRLHRCWRNCWYFLRNNTHFGNLSFVCTKMIAAKLATSLSIAKEPDTRSKISQVNTTLNCLENPRSF